MREREDANRTREAGNRDEVEGVVANWLRFSCKGRVGFIVWLDGVCAMKPKASDDQPDDQCDDEVEQPPKQKKKIGVKNLLC